MNILLPIKNTNELYTVNPTKIIALGLNYREHIEESPSINIKGVTREIPKEPVLFTKTPNVLIPDGSSIIIPRFLKDYRFDNFRVDYEAELAFFIKDRCKSVPAVEAYEHILGFTCMNDVSQRNIQSGDISGWFRGKSLDTFGPIGPRMVRTEDLSDPQNLDISCRLNGKVVQNSNTRFMIFTIEEIVAFISKNLTLMPGDLILTATPSGVGPIHHGDTVEIEIDQIGTLVNQVIEE